MSKSLIAGFGQPAFLAVAAAGRDPGRLASGLARSQGGVFFGEPLKVWGRIWAWFVTSADIYTHLWVTLTETVLAFFIGTAAAWGGLWLGCRRWPARSWIPHQGGQLDAA